LKERREGGRNARRVDGTRRRVIGTQRGWKENRVGGKNSGRVEGTQGGW